MAINALNSGAKVWLADLEDANTPHWDNVIGGQVNLLDAVRRTIEFTTPRASTTRSRTRTAYPVIVPRPRGWHFDEEHLTLDGRPLVGALVDFGLYFFHNAAELLARGQRPLLLPAEDGVATSRRGCGTTSSPSPRRRSASRTARSARPCSSRRSRRPSRWTRSSTSCATTRPGSTPAAGTTCSRIIKYFRDAGPAFTLPDRNAVTMNAPMMKAYSDLLVQTCHRRGAFAIGGMAAFIPSKDPEVNEAAFAKVRADKEREAGAGFDGSWVAHPGMVDALQGDLRPASSATPPTSSTSSATTSRSTAADLLDAASTPGRPDAGWLAGQRLRRHPVPPGLAARQRRRRASTT